MRDDGCVLGTQLGRERRKDDVAAKAGDLLLESLRVRLAANTRSRLVVALNRVDTRRHSENTVPLL